MWVYMYGVVTLSINPRQPVTPTRTHAVMNTPFYSDPAPSQEDAALGERNVLLQPQGSHGDAAIDAETALWAYWDQYIPDIDHLFEDGNAVENGNDDQNVERRNSVAADPGTCCEKEK